MTDKDRVVFIAGATGGVGRATAATFAAEGCRLALGGRNAERLAEIGGELGLGDDRWVAAVGDFRDGDQARAAVASVIDAFGGIDVLLHLVGGYAGGTALVEVDPAETRDMIDQHIWTTLNLVRTVVPGMVERGWGRVIAAGTAASVTAPAKAGPYAAAKAAQEVLLRSLAKEVSGSGVTVNLVAMRMIDEKHERESSPSPKNVSWTTPEEIAATIRWLASDAAASVNGVRIPLDGRT